MKKLIQRISIPMAALILALAALGNLLASYGEGIRNVFGGISLVLYLLMAIKLLTFRDQVKEDLKNPVQATVLPAFSMATMLLATYLKALSPELGKIVWFLGLILHIYFIVSFSLKFLPGYSINTVFPSWFVMYVGIAVAGVTAPAFQQLKLGRFSFWFGLVSYIVLMPLVIKRLRTMEMPKPAKPTFVIIAAPAALLLAAYMNSFEVKNMAMVYGLLVLSQLAYFLALAKLPGLFSLGFMPSFAGFTFPLVISGLSLKLSNKFLAENGNPIGFLKYLVKFEELIALGVTLLVLVMFIKFLLEDK